jgi:hypothetical protein
VSVSVTGQTMTSMTVRVNASNSATKCTVAMGGGASKSCGTGIHTYTFSGLNASSTYRFTATVTDAYQQSASRSASGNTKVVSTRNACVKAEKDCSVGIYPAPNQSGTSVGKWKRGASVTVQCTANGEEIYAYNQNGNRRSPVWLRISSGYVPWAYSDMSTSTRDSLPTC